MVKYCAVFGCNSSSASGRSMFPFPKDKNLRKICSIRTKRKNFTATDHSYICCKHLVSERDYIQHSKKKLLKAGAVPSIFAWTKLPALRRHIERRDVVLNDSSTDTVSETESSTGNAVEASIRTSYSTFCLKFLEHHKGSISDKEICQRSGFLNLLKWKMSNGELHAGDSVMTDKGFNIVDELQQIGLVLNVHLSCANAVS